MPTLSATISFPPLAAVKMEDRKRPAMDDAERRTPPAKRQAVAVNGVSSHQDSEMPWKDDLELYQKDAILRQMREYKREKTDLEARLSDLKKNSEYHDEHLRIIDAWFLQLLDEISLLAPPNAAQQPSDLQFSSSLLSADLQKFNNHLSQRSNEIKDALKRIYSNFPSLPPDSEHLTTRLSELLALEKQSTSELHRVKSERDQLSEQLENASYRYMIAEKKLDRLKSAQVAKIEAQAISASRADSSSKERADSGSKDTSLPSPDSQLGTAVEAAKREALAVAEKRAEQVDKLSQENKNLTAELTTVRARLTGLSDEDYAHSELFKALKQQHEEVVKRINDLEATNIQLREEAKKMQAERSSYREETDNELRNNTIEMQTQLTQVEADLTRIRRERDGLRAELDERKATAEDYKITVQHLKDLTESRGARISALEAEAQRLKADQPAVSGEAPELDRDAANARVLVLENEKSVLESELTSMETAWRKASGAASKKISDVSETEDKLAKLSAEKAKADQKYFAAMRLKDSKESELNLAKRQNAESSKIITQLKESESSCRGVIATMEKQLAEARETSTSLTLQQRSSQQVLSEQRTLVDRSEKQVTDLKKLVTDKDAKTQMAAQLQRQAEIELSKLRIRLEETEKNLESWRKKSAGNESGEFEQLRSMAVCGVCQKNFKNTALKTCGHIICQDCTDKQLTLRSRKCPICGKAFGSGDVMRITL